MEPKHRDDFPLFQAHVLDKLHVLKEHIIQRELKNVTLSRILFVSFVLSKKIKLHFGLLLNICERLFVRQIAFFYAAFLRLKSEHVTLEILSN